MNDDEERRGSKFFKILIFFINKADLGNSFHLQLGSEMLGFKTIEFIWWPQQRGILQSLHLALLQIARQTILLQLTKDLKLTVKSPLDNSFIIGSCAKLLSMVKVQNDQFKLFELDCRVGLNAAHHFESYACLIEEQKHRFYVYLGDISIDKFTKSTYLNIVSFAEKHGANSIVLILDREHP